MKQIVVNPDTPAPQAANASAECLINKTELARRVGRKVRTVDYWMARGADSLPENWQRGSFQVVGRGGALATDLSRVPAEPSQIVTPI